MGTLAEGHTRKILLPNEFIPNRTLHGIRLVLELVPPLIYRRNRLMKIVELFTAVPESYLETVSGKLPVRVHLWRCLTFIGVLQELASRTPELNLVPAAVNGYRPHALISTMLMHVVFGKVPC